MYYSTYVSVRPRKTLCMVIKSPSANVKVSFSERMKSKTGYDAAVYVLDASSH